MDFARSAPLDPVQTPSPRLPVPGGRLSTPVMHPRLVETLKSMISSFPRSSHQSGGLAGNGMNEASTEQRSEGFVNGMNDASTEQRTKGIVNGMNEASAEQRRKAIVRRGAGKRKPTLRRQHQQQQFHFEQHLASGGAHFEDHLASGGAELVKLDEDEAAVVPVDLILNRRPFRCAYADCSKTFKNQQTMRMHHKTHYNEDSLSRLADADAEVYSNQKAGVNKKIRSLCPKCEGQFVGLYELRRHFGRKHSVGEKQFVCGKCDKRYYVEVDLRDHAKLCGESILCKCGMKFAFKCNLVAHKKGHPECQDPPSEAANGTSIGETIVPPARATRKGNGKFKLRKCVMASSTSLPPLFSPSTPSGPSAEALPPPVYSHEQLSFDLSFPGPSTIGSEPLSSSIFDFDLSMPDFNYLVDFNYPYLPQDQAP